MNSAARFSLEGSGESFSNITVNVLAAVFMLASFGLPTIAFFYPLEIETRESTVWLHVLAMKEGINVYDYGKVAFINTHHGPLDSSVKLLVARFLPFLESWQVIRWAVFLLPFAFLVVGWKLVGKASRSPVHVLYLSSIGYLLLVLTAKDWLFVGRNDATAALLILLLMYATISFAPKNCLAIGWHGIVCGIFGSAVILTNWRLAPTSLAILGFALWMYKKANGNGARQIVLYLLSYLLASVAVWSLLILHHFDFDLARYWAHFFGYFLGPSGAGSRAYGHASAIWFLGSLFKPVAAPENLKGAPLLLALTVYILIPGKAAPVNKAWIGLCSVVFGMCALAFYLNYYGGGQWYFIPFGIILWCFVCDNAASMNATRLAALGAVTSVFLLLNFNTVVAPTLWRLSTMGQAYDFMAKVRTLEESHTVLSEDTFLFRSSYRGELIDMGDQIHKVRKRHYYGDDFNRTVDRHFEKIRREPPDYIVTGFTASPELRQLMEHSYIVVEEGPGNFTANGFGESRLLRRKDLSHPQQHGSPHPRKTLAVLDNISVSPNR
jgi:hypothetical protein